MKIVYLDLSSLVKAGEQLDFLPIQKSGQFVTYSHTESPQLAGRAGDAEIVITIKNRLFAEELAQMPKLRMICKAGSGTDNIDLEAARARNITVCNLPDYGSYMVAQWTWGFIMAMANQYGVYDRAMRGSDKWRDISFAAPVIELQRKTLGLVGFGRIAKHVAGWAESFGMRVLVHTSSQRAHGFTYADLDQLAQQSDFVSIHCPLNLRTRGMIGTAFFNQMKPTAYLINTARGAVVHEKALLYALEHRQIAGAALDVFEKEPLPVGHSLMKFENVLLTPHMAWSALETRQRVIEQAGDVITRFINGSPINVVNGMPG